MFKKHLCDEVIKIMNFVTNIIIAQLTMIMTIMTIIIIIIIIIQAQVTRLHCWERSLQSNPQ